MPLPISAKCITYGRVDFLEEALQSFLLQDYAGERELVIVNDYPLQTLHFDHPQVRIYTWGTWSYHMSGLGTDDGTRPNVLVRHAEHIEQLRLQGLIPTGDVELRPRWRHDYPGHLARVCR